MCGPSTSRALPLFAGPWLLPQIPALGHDSHGTPSLVSTCCARASNSSCCMTSTRQLHVTLVGDSFFELDGSLSMPLRVRFASCRHAQSLNDGSEDLLFLLSVQRQLSLSCLLVQLLIRIRIAHLVTHWQCQLIRRNSSCCNHARALPFFMTNCFLHHLNHGHLALHHNGNVDNLVHQI